MLTDSILMRKNTYCAFSKKHFDIQDAKIPHCIDFYIIKPLFLTEFVSYGYDINKNYVADTLPVEEE